MSRILIRGGRLIDPSEGLDCIQDILIDKGKIKAIGQNLFEMEAIELNAENLIVCPSFIDLHTHLREPGQEYKEDIASGSKCAVAGGFTLLISMPNTIPAVDSPQVASYIIQRAKSVGLCKVLPSGAITMGRKGKELTDFLALKEAGCVALTDDGSPLMDSKLMELALKRASQLDMLIMNHCEDDKLANGAINSGVVSSLIGLSTRPKSAEDVLVARDCVLSFYTGGRLHIQHLSSPLSAEIIDFFKSKGAPITCEVNPYHLLFSEEELFLSGANAKLNPPLRDKKDIEILLNALRAGIIDCIATDHAPHAIREKSRLDSAMPGMIGLQLALPLCLKLVEDGHISMSKLVELLSIAPSRVLKLKDPPKLKVGAKANITIFDPKREWILNEFTSFSKSKNTPLWGKTLKGKVIFTIYEGRIVYSDV
ncbi:MAG: dihydroorotase [Aquificaceae bacterium]|nr:dihydroorotase [Aquificaceae bacterium]MDW8237340.1 dihydroorotase [Aquificaceae bacterium]